MKNHVFEIDNIKKIYNERTVLNIDSLRLEKGLIHAIIGPNGSGKSTLLRLLALLDEPSAGNIKAFDTDYLSLIKEKIKWQRKMTMVMQKTFLFNQSVASNVEYGLKVRDIYRGKRKKIVEETLEWVGMSSFGQRNALTLSGGEAQRVALARAIVFRPDVLFLDEPTASLDPASVLVIEDLIKKINQQFETTIIIVTHNLFQARRLADTTMVLMDGRVVEKGLTEEIFSRSNDERTRAFFAGEMIY